MWPAPTWPPSSASPPPPNPTLSMIVVLDRPTPIFGGTVAAPVFSQIMSYALHRYDIPTTPGAATQAPAGTTDAPTRRRTSREPVPSTARRGRAQERPWRAAVGSTMRTVQMNLLFDDIDVTRDRG